MSDSAASVGARAAIVLGPDEVARGIALVKDMESGEQTEMSLERLTRVSDAVAEAGEPARTS